MLGFAVKPHLKSASLRVDVPAELRRDHNFVAKRFDALAENALALKGSVSLGGVKKRHAVVVCRSDDIDNLRAIRHERFVTAAHVLHAEAHARDLKRTELASSTQVRLRASLGFRRYRKAAGDCRGCYRTRDAEARYPQESPAIQAALRAAVIEVLHFRTFHPTWRSFGTDRLAVPSTAIPHLIPGLISAPFQTRQFILRSRQTYSGVIRWHSGAF